MALSLPKPADAARQEAARINAHRHQFLEGPVERVLADCPRADRAALLAGLAAFHRERMARTPSFTTFPEARPWVEHAVALERELRAAASLSEQEIAVLWSLGHYLTFRGYVNAAPPQVERCRVAFLPQTDQGGMHIKNIDDPDTFWQSPAPMAKTYPWTDAKAKFLVWDGVGSGMHIDDEPAEIFPLHPPRMYEHYCDDVPSAVEFLTRYSPFWGGQNIVLRDAQDRSVAIEKCSYNFIEVFHPDRTGRSWCSGMATRDPGSPQGRYQRRQRAKYLKLFGMADDCADAAFWNACDQGERMLGEFLKRPGAITVKEVFDLFTTPFPRGLCKTGAKFHPQQGYGEYTLMTCAGTWTATRRQSYRWARGDKPGLAWPSAPEVAVSIKPVS